jgi:hypothetical protein
MSSASKKPSARRVQYGVLPYRMSNGHRAEFMLVTSRETRRWIIPKGWPKKGKSPHRSAAREANTPEFRLLSSGRKLVNLLQAATIPERNRRGPPDEHLARDRCPHLVCSASPIHAGRFVTLTQAGHTEVPATSKVATAQAASSSGFQFLGFGRLLTHQLQRAATATLP